VSIFDELFNPASRYREEEKNRLEWMRDEEGEGDPHHGPIDLDGGIVQIRVAAQADGHGDASPDGSRLAGSPSIESPSIESPPVE
jgi:Family of unknown function (DUF6191)